MISKNRIKQIHALARKKGRQAEGLFVAEGPKLVTELQGSFELEALFDDLTEDELKKASLLQSPQGPIALFKIPAWELPQPAAGTLYLALDTVQDPGNLGTIVRVADWFGIETILCSHDTADAYNPKVIQATMGSIARVRIIYTDLPKTLESLASTMPVYGTFLDGENIHAKQLPEEAIIVMGNEGKGISQEVARLVTDRILIPNYPEGRPTADSLNVAIATAITCAEFRRNS
jgi:TrmH family RNA methyltransferase